MPKMKTNKTAAKRFKVTGSGRVKRAQANTSHNTAKKTQKQKRKLRSIVSLDNSNYRAVALMLPSKKTKRISAQTETEISTDEKQAVAE